MTSPNLPKKPASHRNARPATENDEFHWERKPLHYDEFAIPGAGGMRSKISYERSTRNKDKGTQTDEEEGEEEAGDTVDANGKTNQNCAG